MNSRLIYGEDEHGELYAKFRPMYTDEIYRTIYEFCEEDKPFGYELAVDVGCGNGQSTLPLCRKFRNVIGCDISPAQIKYAKRGFGHLAYVICPGENMSFLKDSSVDLVTLGTALHWFDQEAFYKEVERVLKPGGVMAAYGYASLHVDKEQGHLAYKHLYDTILPYWGEEHFSCKEQYGDVHFPFKDTRWFHQGELNMITTSSVDEFVGLLSTQHAYRDYSKNHPASTILEDTRKTLYSIYGKDHLTIHWQMFMVIGRKPTI